MAWPGFPEGDVGLSLSLNSGVKSVDQTSQLCAAQVMGRSHLHNDLARCEAFWVVRIQRKLLWHGSHAGEINLCAVPL